MKKMLFPGFVFFCFLFVLLTCSCVSGAAVDTMRRGTGTPLGTVYAAAAVWKNRAGEITGDTHKYGHIDGVTTGLATERKTRSVSRNAAVPESTADKALANALYEIIRQIREKGGDAVTNIVTDIDRNYDPQTNIETVTVKVSALAVKTENNF